jgi:hypothetical protein
VQLIVDIPDENLAKKIIKLLNIFKEDGVKVSYENLKKAVTTKNWKDEIMTNENPDIDDDEILPQAYWEYYNEKYSN